ncbi:MAG: DUF547 domain-containing protein [Crocinitomix sp.]|nr:DUF547 domain-containing protein [Crocinitomix sp.]
MRQTTLFIALFIVLSALGQVHSDFFNRADVFFKTYTKDGRVNYQALRENPADLDWLVDYVATETIESTTRKAYLINAYNILVIDQLVDHPTLVDSPMKIAGFFDNKSGMVEGKKISLNALENEMIRPIYNDPRVHFVLVCGGLGCPPIASYAYRPEKLDLQMDHQTKLAFNGGDFVYADVDKKSIYLSQIFEWYQSDFGASTGDVVAYINTFKSEPFNADFKVKYYDYDWTINKASFEIIPVEIDEPELPHKDEVYKPKSEKKELEDIEPEIKPEDVEVPESADLSQIFQTIPVLTPINLQTFTAGSLLAKGKFDFTLFNTLYTENHNLWQGQEYSGYRATFVTHLAQVTYGITESKRINVGLDVNFKNSGRSSVDSTYGGISNAFAYANNDSARVGITSIGARIKVQPFKAVSNFSIQSTLFMPTVRHPEGFNDPEGLDNLYWADWDRITWWNQLFIDKTFGDFQVFAELDFLFRFKRYDSQIGMLDMPASVFVSYFPTKKITVYGMTQHVARFTNNINGHDPIVTDWVIPMNYTASGIGFKYQLRSNLNIEALYTNFWRGKNSGLGETFNIGVKFLTR